MNQLKNCVTGDMVTKQEEDDKTEWIEERIAIAMEGSALTHYQAYKQAERDWEKENKSGGKSDRCNKGRGAGSADAP